MGTKLTCINMELLLCESSRSRVEPRFYFSGLALVGICRVCDPSVSSPPAAGKRMKVETSDGCRRPAM